MSPRNVSAGTDEEFETVVEPYAPTFSFENEGDTITGTYLSTRKVDLPDLNKPGEMRESNLYEILSDSDGSKYSVWGAFSIDEAFSKIVVGQRVRIVFHGKVKIKSGAQEVNQFTVAVSKS